MSRIETYNINTTQYHKISEMDGLQKTRKKKESANSEKIEWKTPKLKHRGEKKNEKITRQRSVGQYYMIHHACNWAQKERE